MKSAPFTKEISLGLIKQLIESKLLELKFISYNDNVELTLPWKEEFVPVGIVKWKEEPVKVIRHIGKT